ncbi:MAG: hypothetical protein E7395_00760 [Ruminococcaceae bacterium]|nr:hypothetical protein [Oscillospiraceae bacterium]
MCNIAGYAGEKRAAPILIEMIKRQQYFDGGLSTGIATIHNGKLYSAKILGDADDLIQKTDALSLPGTIGIIHSRPDNDFIQNAHPFLCENKQTAIVENGNACKDEAVLSERSRVVNLLLDNGFVFDSAVVKEKSTNPQLNDGRYVSYDEVYAKYIEYLRKENSLTYPRAMAKASSDLFSDSVYLMLSANSPDNIYVSRMTRPMNIMKADGECYISTSQMAFPELDNAEYIKTLPHMKICVVTKDGYAETDNMITTGTVTDYIPEEFADIKEALRRKLQKAPSSMDGMGGGITVSNVSPHNFRPHVKVIYDALWELHKEGVLKTEIRTSSLSWLPESIKVKRTFFSV